MVIQRDEIWWADSRQRFLPQGATGLNKDSAANVSQVVTLDKAFLTERVGVLGVALLERVEDGLRLSM